jgi:hypothetical protein
VSDFEVRIKELEVRFEELRGRVVTHESKIDYLIKSVEQLLATSSDRRDSQRIVVLIVLTLLSIVFQLALAVVRRI